MRIVRDIFIMLQLRLKSFMIDNNTGLIYFGLLLPCHVINGVFVLAILVLL